MSHGNLSMALFLFSSTEATLIDEQQSNYFILTVVPWDLYTQHQVTYDVNPSLCLSTFTSTMPPPMAFGGMESFPPPPSCIKF